MSELPLHDAPRSWLMCSIFARVHSRNLNHSATNLIFFFSSYVIRLSPSCKSVKRRNCNPFLNQGLSEEKRIKAVNIQFISSLVQGKSKARHRIKNKCQNWQKPIHFAHRNWDRESMQLSRVSLNHKRKWRLERMQSFLIESASANDSFFFKLAREKEKVWEKTEKRIESKNQHKEWKWKWKKVRQPFQRNEKPWLFR